jgi:predicted O-methyltransferase YrrM
MSRRGVGVPGSRERRAGPSPRRSRVTMEYVGAVESGRLRRVIEGLVDNATVVAALDGSVHDVFPVAIDHLEGEALRDCVIHEGAVRTIEIGLGYGVSSLYIVEGLLSAGGSGPRHVAIDPYQEVRFRNCGLQLLDEAGVALLVDHYPEESQVVLPRLLSERQSFDLAFVDGNHRFDSVFVDLFYLGRLLRPGGVVFIDDYQLPGVARASAFFANNVDWTLESSSPDDHFHRWAVFRTNTKPDARPFTYFVDF